MDSLHETNTKVQQIEFRQGENTFKTQLVVITKPTEASQSHSGKHVALHVVRFEKVPK